VKKQLPSSKQMSLKLVPRNAEPANEITDAGIAIELSNEHPENAPDPISNS
jgi:hypothetical protein